MVGEWRAQLCEKQYHILSSRAIETGASAPVVGSTRLGLRRGSGALRLPAPAPGPAAITRSSLCAFQVFDDFVIHATLAVQE